MKKFSILFLVLILILALNSCKDKEKETETAESTATNQESPETQALEKVDGLFDEKITGFDLVEGYETPVIFR